MKKHLLKKLHLKKVRKMSKVDQLILGLVGIGALILACFCRTFGLFQLATTFCGNSATG